MRDFKARTDSDDPGADDLDGELPRRPTPSMHQTGGDRILTARGLKSSERIASRTALGARPFSELLRGPFAGAFPEVVFAVLGTHETSANHCAFADVFGDLPG